jgi:two-component system OmpR family sensor kinase/two-component system sensor histidine kinase BaeS
MRNLFRQLGIQLSLAFVLVGLGSLLVIGVVAPSIINPQFVWSAVDDHLRRPGGPIQDLENYYRTHASWDGIETVFESGPFGAMDNTLVFTDANGQVIFGNPDLLAESQDNPNRFERPVPIMVDGQAVGYVTFAGGGWMDTPLQDAAYTRVSQVLIVTMLAVTVLGILVGVGVSRGLSAPLDRLAAGVRAFGKGNLSQRVKVEGSQEIATVARAFNEMASALEDAEIQRRNMVADVAHELRTPLTVIQGNLQAILDDVYPLEKEEIARLYDQTRLLSRLVEDLRLLSQADAGVLTLEFQTRDLTHLVAEQAEALKAAAERRGVELKTELTDGLPPVRVDVARLGQVLHNLFDNALRYTPQGGSITIRVAADGDGLKLEVRDTGEGILAEHLPHVFDRFYRADTARARESGGSGLGLAIARSIVEAHGGRIQAESAGVAGQGSTFVVHLPASWEETGAEGQAASA